MHTETVAIGNRTITFEAGHVARQASGAVIVKERQSYLIAAVSRSHSHGSLAVDYQERMSLSGRLNSRREGRGTDAQVLTSRLIDHMLRPLLHAGGSAHEEIEVVVTVLGADGKSDLDSLALCGAAAALHLSDIPAPGPVAGLRLCRGPASKDGAVTLMPKASERDQAGLDLALAAGADGLVMVDGRADRLPEAELQQVLGGACEQLQPLLLAFSNLRAAVGREKRPMAGLAALDAAAEAALREFAQGAVEAALPIGDKETRRMALIAAEREALARFAGQPEGALRAAFRELVRGRLRARLLDGQRCGGRAVDALRPIQAQTGLLGACHGSALFTRGQTQVLVGATLISDPSPPAETHFLKDQEHFSLLYHFPAYAAGETRPHRGPSRRETGHGHLARMGLWAVLPEPRSFPYHLRLSSEVLEADGSSSMATVAAGCLAMFDAGVPLQEPVAGVSMGLIVEGERRQILTDLEELEDFKGDLDLKVAGTRGGVTALQMDNKIGMLPLPLFGEVLEAARAPRGQVLDALAEVLPAPRQVTASKRQFVKLQIPASAIGRLIGPGGKHIDAIRTETKTSVQVDDDGTVIISGKDQEALQAARRRVLETTLELRREGVYLAHVRSVQSYGAIVAIGDHSGLVHLNELDEQAPAAAADLCKAGEEMLVRLLGVDERGRLRFSRRAALGAQRSEAANL